MYFKGLLERTDIPLDVKEAIRAGSSEIEDLRKRLENLNLQYQYIIDSMTEAVHIVDQDLKILYVNKKFQQWIQELGYEDIEFNKSVIESFKFLPTGVKDEYNQVFTTGRSIVTEEENTVKEKKYYTETQKIPVFQDNKVYRVITIIKDVTNRKNAENAVQRTQHQLRDMFDNTPIAVYVKDLNGRYMLVNRQWCERTGIEEQYALGKTIKEIYPDNPVEAWLAPEKQVIESEKAIQIEEVGHTTGRIYLATKFLLRDSDGKAYALCNSSIDITERKMIQEALKQSEEKYRRLIEQLQEGVLLENLDGRVTFINSKMISMLGYSEDEILGAYWTKFVPEDEYSKVIKETGKRLSGKSSVYETTLLAKDGSHIPVILSAAPVYSNDAEITGVLCVFNDITERKRTEKMLIESKKLLRQVIDLVPQQIFAKDASGRFIFANEAVAAAYGTTVDNIVNTYQKDLHYSDEELEVFLASDKEVIDSKIPVFIPEELFTDSNGVTHTVQTLKIPFEVGEDKESAILGVATDITDLKKAENTLKLIKAEEERYHAMLSHFTRNELQKIVNNIDFLKLEYESSKLLNNEILNRIVSIADRSSKTMDNVNRIFEVLQMPFSPPSSPVNLLQTITQSKKLLKSLENLVEVDQNVSKIELFVDLYINDVFKEIFLFVENYHKETTPLGSKISILGLNLPTHYSLCIKENITPSIPKEIALSLSGKITDEWESQGHYVGISLVSVIMEHYRGEMRIEPLSEKGNEFQLLFPKDLVNNTKEDF